MLNRTIEEYEQDSRQKYLIDMRRSEDYDRETMQGAVNYEYERWEERLPELQEKQAGPVYLLCYTGDRSDDWAEQLQEMGYEAYSITGGYQAYLSRELKDMMERLDTEEQESEQYCREVERSIVKKFRKDIWRKFTQGINEYEMIKDGDKIAVCISGGKDSMLMAKLMQLLQRYGDVPFELTFLVMDPGYNEKNRKKIEENAKILNVPITVFETNIFDVANSVDKSPCYLCARMRRGYLYSRAKELGCNKIALGHHFDDVIETTLIGMFYASQLKAMIPKLHSTNFEGMELIRPMYCIHEEDIIAWMNYNGLEFIQCACRFTENYTLNNNEGGMSKRQEIKMLIRQLKKDNPLIDKSIFNSIHAVSLDTMPGYKTHGKTYSFLDNYYNNERSEEQL